MTYSSRRLTEHGQNSWYSVLFARVNRSTATRVVPGWGNEAG